MAKRDAIRRVEKRYSVAESRRRGNAVGDRAVAGTAASEIGVLSGDPNFMTSLARGIAVICAFSRERRNQTIAQISHKTGIPRSAVRRCLHTLAKLGYVYSDARTFSLRPKILALGHAYLASTSLGAMAQGFLDRVSASVHESCSLAILDGDEILYVARSTKSMRIMSVDLDVGSRLPAYCTSMGRVLLAHLPEPAFEDYLSRVQLRPFTDRTLISRSRLREAVENIRRTGYALVNQELELGLRSIAVPVRDSSGEVVAAMNVSAQAGRVTMRHMTTQFLRHLQEASNELGLLLLP
jgi:IclR family transcriptional regulator, pca regulon regulatory protein